MQPQVRILRQSGFTLIEIVVSIVLLGILSIVGANMLSDSFSTSNFVSRETVGVGNIRYALERIGREIRETRTVVANTGTSITFIKNNNATVSISIDGNKVILTSGSYNATLADNVNSFGLVYRDADLAVTTVPNAIRYVDIALSVLPTDSPSVAAVSGPNISLSTRIALRVPA